MKNFNLRKGVIAVLALAAIGCTKSKEGGDYVTPDHVEVSFPATGETSMTITVDASSANWTATPNKDWITLSEQTATSVVVSVADNTGVERDGEIVFALGSAKTTMKVYQNENADLPARFRKFDYYESAAISPSGKYITAMGGGTDNGSMVTNVYRIDVATDETILVGTYPSETALSAPYCITDDGAMMFYSQGGGSNTVLIDPDGSNLTLSYPDLGLGTPRIRCVSTDNSIWGGYLSGTGEGSVPYVFVDGEPSERLPIPDTNFRGAPKKHGIYLRGGSADGSMFYGASADNYDFGMCYWDKEHNFHWVGGDRHKTKAYETTDAFGNPKTVYVVEWGVQCEDEVYKMSPNGKYIGGRIYEETFDEAQGAAVGNVTGACVYDTETDELFEMPSGHTVLSITDGGLAVVAESGGYGITSTYIYDLNTQTSLGDSAEWVRENFGIDISGTGCFVTYITGENNDVIFGNYMPDSGLTVYNYWYAVKNK